ncbi:MAG: outer membrane protein assembly factor BamD [Gemmatimonadetes bacterium]|nr:outer membrane protein assembly factor BamD [Gemmatimonadota bacterium]
MPRMGGALLILLAAGGCGGGGLRLKDYVTPETLLEASKREFRRGHFSDARAGFQKVTFDVPGNDPLGAEARYYLAECYFAQRDYVEASRHLRRVADDYPDHALAPDALLRSGDALAAQWAQVELDPTTGEEALAVYRELTTRYAESRAAERARLRLQALADRFAEKEYRAGVFYFRVKAYDSAIIYLRSVAANYGESSVTPQALIKLVEAYRRINYSEELRETCAHLRQYYPKAKGLNDACPATEPTSP